MFRTLGRKPHPPAPTLGTDTLLSGVLIVTYNQKRSVTKYVEVKFNGDENKTALVIYKNKEKKKPEVAVDLSLAKVIINHECSYSIVYIAREGRFITLELSKDREDLERYVTQWRSVFQVSEDPQNMFSVISISGDNRGCVMLVTMCEDGEVKFKFLHGTQKNTEISVKQIARVQKYSEHEVFLETSEGESYHFLTKRPNSLIAKLEEKASRFPENAPFPTKASDNNAAFYESRSGYTPAFQQERAVIEVQDADYLPMGARRDGGIMEDEYLCMDHSKFEGGIMEDDYLSMDHSKVEGGIMEDDYLCMDHSKVEGGIMEDDYLPMQYKDSLIADYLSKDDIDNMSSNGSALSPDADYEMDEEDPYFDPSVVNICKPPPIPPRLQTPVLKRANCPKSPILAHQPEPAALRGTPRMRLNEGPSSAAATSYCKVELAVNNNTIPRQEVPSKPISQYSVVQILPLPDSRPVLPPREQGENIVQRPTKPKKKKRPKSMVTDRSSIPRTPSMRDPAPPVPTRLHAPPALPPK